MKKIVTIIEITDIHIKLLQAEKTRGKCVVRFCDIRPVERCSPEETALVLKDMVGALPATPADVMVVIPRRLVILRQMRLPSHHHEELRDMIGLQLVNHIPFPVEDVIYQYHLLEQDHDGYSRILVMVIHKEVSQRYHRLAQAAGVKEGSLALSSLGILEWAASREKDFKAAQKQPVMVLNPDIDHSEICFCHHRRLFFSRSVPLGGKYVTGGGDVSELARHLKLSLTSYQKECLGPEIKKILIVSDAKECSVLAVCLEQELNMPVEVAGPLSHALCSFERGLREGLLQKGHSITPGLGLMLSDTKNVVNLISGEVQAAKQVKTHRLQLAKFIGLFLAAAALSVSGPVIDVYKKEKYLERLKTEQDLLRSRMAEARKKIQFVQFFDEKFRNYVFIPDLVQELSRLTPGNVSFRTLSVDKQGRLIIEGSAQTHADINAFQTGLIRSSRFHDVDLMFATNRKIANMMLVDFKVAFQLGREAGDGI